LREKNNERLSNPNVFYKVDQFDKITQYAKATQLLFNIYLA
jgi:hypothetical protein